MSGYRPPYTRKEEQLILRYILDESAHYRLRGDAFWKEMAESKVVDRTWHSLKQHFRKHIIFNLNSRMYDLTADERYAIRKAYDDTAFRKFVAIEADNDDLTESDLSDHAESQPSSASRRGPSTSAARTSQSEPENKKSKKKEQVDFFTMTFSDSDE